MKHKSRSNHRKFIQSKSNKDGEEKIKNEENEEHKNSNRERRQEYASIFAEGCKI